MLEETLLSRSTQRLNLRDFAAIGFRHRRLVLLCGIGIVFGAVLAAIVLPKYQAETKIFVNRGRVDPVIAPVAELTNPIANYELTTEEINSEVELLNSYQMLRSVVVACDLQHPKAPFGKALDYVLTIGMDENQKIDRATNKLTKAIDIEAVPKTNVIEVTYGSRDPALSARVLRTLNTFFLDKHREVHRPSGQLPFFQHQAQVYKDRLTAAEARLTSFPAQYGAVSPAADRDAALQKLNEFSAMYQQTQAAKQETEQRIHDLAQQAGTTSNRLTTQVRSSDNPQLLQQLKSALLTLELKRVELLTKFQPTYRPVKEVDKQISDTLASINAENKLPLRDETTDVNPTYQWVISEFAKARTDLSGIEARSIATERTIRSYEARVRDLNTKAIIYQDLVRTAKAEETNFLLYSGKSEESRITDALDEKRILNVAIAEEPLPPALPTHSPLLYGIAGALFAAVLSVGLMFSLEYLDTSFRTPREVEDMLQTRVLAAIPFQTTGHNGADGKGVHRVKDDLHSFSR